MVTKMFDSSQWCATNSNNVEIGNGQEVQKGKANQGKIMIAKITVEEVIQKRDNGWSPFILDVRSEMEYNQARIAAVDLQIEHTSVQSIMNDLPADRDVLVHCKSGVRSQMAIMLLAQSGFDSSRLFNLSGGIIAWHAAKPDEIIN
jgi:adenylyltransferase/sulfurtransferase